MGWHNGAKDLGGALIPAKGAWEGQGAAPGLSRSQAGCGGPQVLPPPPPQPCRQGVTPPEQSPGHPAPRRGTGINRKRLCPGRGHRLARNVPVATGLFVWS